MAAQSPPVIYNAYVLNSAILSGSTDTITVHGSGFTTSSTVLVNSVPMSTIYQSSGYLIAQVPVPLGATGSLSIQVKTPSAPTVSAIFSAPIAKIWLNLNAVDAGVQNPTAAELGDTLALTAQLAGSGTTALPPVTWAVSGAGSVSSSGVYQAPATMPANATVRVSATLAANPTVYTSYSFVLVSAPVIYSAYVLNGAILSGTTDTITVHGSGFTASSTVLANSVAMSTLYQSSNYLVAQVPVPLGATGSLSVQVKTPSPLAVSQMFYAPIAKIWLNLNAVDAGVQDPAVVQTGDTVALSAQLGGSGTTAPPPITWAVSGPGSVSSSGVYQAPATMPQDATVQVSATLVPNTKVYTSYYFVLVPAPPVIQSSNPRQLPAGQSNAVTFYGLQFGAGMSLTLNGTPLAVSQQTTSSMVATVTTAAGQSTAATVVAHNPDPNAAASAPFSLPVGTTQPGLSSEVSLTHGLAIPENFLGLSHEWTDPAWLIGNGASGQNLVYIQLLKNLMNGQQYPFSLRIGGGSTDAQGIPSSALAATLAQLTTMLPVHYLLGINLGANNLPLASAQTSFFLSAIPNSSIDAIEIGNEPDDYVSNGLRRAPYSISTYLSDFAKWQSGLSSLHPTSITLMGPSWGEVQSLQSNFAAFEAQESAAVGIVSQHIYAGYQETQSYFPPDFLLSAAAQTGPAGVASAVSEAHAAGQLFRIGELNSIDGGGITGISDTFSAALWAIDIMFRYASVGVDGVNWHGLSGCTYCPFTFSVQSQGGRNTYALTHTNPIYYGWLFFQNAIAGGASLLTTTQPANPNISVWATLDGTGAVRVAIVNKDKQFNGTIAITVPGKASGTVTELLAPSYTSTSGVTLAGQTFDGSADGVILGTPVSQSVNPVNGVYTISLQPVSATLLTLP